MTDAHEGEAASSTPAEADPKDDLTLDMDEKPGVGQELLESLPHNAVVAYRGEPTASERAMLSWQMTDQERYEFAAGVERVSDRLRHMTPQQTEDFLVALDEETRRLNLDLEIHSEDAPGSQDEATPSPTADRSANPPHHSNAQPRRRLNPTKFLPGLLSRVSGRIAEG
ncbi:hypothetical protein V6V47_26395 [Micromonospora sp. CPCC 205539]|uniref:hypothetical protein n=1 Tax=Micromonospora sp. CPCC 205539 TaxID=3122408 RepID=UPI002FF43074